MKEENGILCDYKTLKISLSKFSNFYYNLRLHWKGKFKDKDSFKKCFLNKIVNETTQEMGSDSFYFKWNWKKREVIMWLRFNYTNSKAT